jgi:hypothetical protein
MKIRFRKGGYRSHSSGLVWSYARGLWNTKHNDTPYSVRAMKKDLWHISDKLINAIRNRDVNPENWSTWLRVKNFKPLTKGESSI